MACDVVMARQCHRKHGNVHRMNLTSQEEILAEREAPSALAIALWIAQSGPPRSSRGPFGSSDSDGGISPGSSAKGMKSAALAIAAIGLAVAPEVSRLLAARVWWIRLLSSLCSSTYLYDT
jgi:hypothetical protein